MFKSFHTAKEQKWHVIHLRKWMHGQVNIQILPPIRLPNILLLRIYMRLLQQLLLQILVCAIYYIAS